MKYPPKQVSKERVEKVRAAVRENFEEAMRILDLAESDGYSHQMDQRLMAICSPDVWRMMPAGDRG